MNSKWKVLILASLCLLAGVVGGGYFYLKSQFKADEVRLSLISYIERQVPQSKVEVGELTIDYGASLTIHVDEFKMNLKGEKRSPLLSLPSFRATLPLLSIITGGGNLDIRFQKPKLYWIESEEEPSPWDLALKSKTREPIDKNRPKEGTRHLVLPAFLINSTVAMRLNDLEILRSLEAESKKNISIKKLVVKNLGLNSNAAFEVNSFFQRELAEEKNISFNLFVVGGVELSDYLKTGILRVKSTYKVNDLEYSELKEPFGPMRGNLSFDLSKEGTLTGESSVIYNKTQLKTEFALTEFGYKLTNIDGTVALADLNPVWEKLGFPAQSGKAGVSLKGGISFENNKIDPLLSLSASQVSYKYKNWPTLSDIDVNFESNEIYAKSVTSFWKGKVLSELKTKFLINSDLPFHERMERYLLDIQLNNLIVPTKSLRLLSKKKPSKKESEFVNTSQKQDGKGHFLLPRGQVTVGINGVQVEDFYLEGGGSLKTEMNKFSVTKFTLLQKESKAIFSLKGELFKNKIQSKITAEFNQFNAQVFNSFVDEDRKMVTGIFEGKVDGQLVWTEGLDYSLKAEGDFKDGTFKNLPLSKYQSRLYSLIEESRLFNSSWSKGLQSKPLEELKDFQEIRVAGTFNRDYHHIKRVKILSEDYNLSLKGKVYMDEEKKGYLDLDYVDKTIEDTLSKKTTSLTFPTRLYSEGGYSFELSPLYSAKKMRRKLKSKRERSRINRLIKRNKINRTLGGKNEKS